MCIIQYDHGNDHGKLKKENERLREIVRKQTEALKAVEKWNAPMSLEIYPAIKISNAIKLGEGI